MLIEFNFKNYYHTLKIYMSQTTFPTVCNKLTLFSKSYDSLGLDLTKERPPIKKKTPKGT